MSRGKDSEHRDKNVTTLSIVLSFEFGRDPSRNSERLLSSFTRFQPLFPSSTSRRGEGDLLDPAESVIPGPERHPHATASRGVSLSPELDRGEGRESTAVSTVFARTGQ